MFRVEGLYRENDDTVCSVLLSSHETLEEAHEARIKVMAKYWEEGREEGPVEVFSEELDDWVDSRTGRSKTLYV